MVWSGSRRLSFNSHSWFGLVLRIGHRLSTCLRMRRWGLEKGCVYCGEQNEDRDHLFFFFFAYPYTFNVRRNIARGLLGATIMQDWEDTMRSILQTHRSRLDNFASLVFHTAIYTFQREGNSRRHGTACVSVDAIAWIIAKILKNCISSLRYTGIIS